jgi:hypothetical protein
MFTRLFKIIFVVAALLVAGGILIVSTPVRATDDDPAAFLQHKVQSVSRGNG